MRRSHVRRCAAAYIRVNEGNSTSNERFDFGGISLRGSKVMKVMKTLEKRRFPPKFSAPPSGYTTVYVGSEKVFEIYNGRPTYVKFDVFIILLFVFTDSIGAGSTSAVPVLWLINDQWRFWGFSVRSYSDSAWRHPLSSVLIGGRIMTSLILYRITNSVEKHWSIGTQTCASCTRFQIPGRIISCSLKTNGTDNAVQLKT